MPYPAGALLSKGGDRLSTYTDASIYLKEKRKLSYKLYGDSNENTIIYFHGFGSSSSAIHPDISILDEYNVRFIAVDRPGYGESDIRNKYTLENVADDINELLVYLKIQKTIVLGWSAGGLYSQVFANKYPDKVISLNLVSSAILLHSKETQAILPLNWKLIQFMNRYMPYFAKVFFRKLSKELLGNKEATIQKSIQQMVNADKRVALDPLMKPFITKGAVEAYQNQGRAVYEDAVALCGKIAENRTAADHIKVNIWQGGKDNVWTTATSDYLHRKYANSTYSIVDDEGHLLYLSRWKEIIKRSLA